MRLTLRSSNGYVSFATSALQDCSEFRTKTNCEELHPLTTVLELFQTCCFYFKKTSEQSYSFKVVVLTALV